MRHERQTLLPWWNQRLVNGADVAVLGCGAIGSQLALACARLGVRSMLLVDPDVLEEHNLENQVYDAVDIGKPKVVALAERIRRVDKNADVRFAVSRVEQTKLPLPSFLFGCFDNGAARHYVNFRAIAEQRTLIDAGISGMLGTVTVVQPKKTACLACHPFLPPNAKRASCSSEPIPSTYVTASTVAGLQLTQFIKLVHCLPTRTHLSFDLLRSTLYGHDFERNPECEICGHT